MPSIIIGTRNSQLPVDLIIYHAVQAGVTVTNLADGLPILQVTADSQDQLTSFVALFSPDDIGVLRDYFVPNPSNPRFVSKVKVNSQSQFLNRSLGPHEVHNPNFPNYTANQIAKIYEFPKPKSHHHYKIAILTFSGGLLTDNVGRFSDINSYWSLIGIKPEDFPTVNVVSLLGANTSFSNDPANGNVENTLDVEIVGACCPTSTTQITLYCAPNSGLGFFTAFVTAITNPGFKPDVILCSWGAPEGNNSSGFLSLMDTVFAYAQSQGINISCPSGDSGYSDGVGDGFAHVDFPASSPHVTSCGGTSLICPELRYGHHTQETGWSGSGGGLSRIFPQPEYQSKLKHYSTARAIPDVALIADPKTPVSIIFNGSIIHVGGTSVSASFLAAYLALLKLKEFINPKLYKASKHHSDSFHDIIIGNNGLYQTQKGYDLVTGLGSIDGDDLAKHV
jgi:kumamolisin